MPISKADMQASLHLLEGEDLEYIKTIIEAGSNTRAAKKLGVDRRNVDRRIKRIFAKMVKKGWAPSHDLTHPLPPGRVLGKTTTLYKDGAPVMQWVAAHPDDEYLERVSQEAMDAFRSEIPRAAPTELPRQLTSDPNLATAYILTDYHLGMLAWGLETGADWDLDIAEDLLVRWFEKVIQGTPNSETGVLAQMGDFLHWDGMEAVTPANKHVLDADTRFEKLVGVAIRVLRRVVSILLTKHPRLHIIMAHANHDPASSVWLRAGFKAFYENEPRIEINGSADGFYCFEHGKTSLFFHHGDKRGIGNVDNVLAAKYREVFGRTQFSYAHLGHLHHQALRETPLMIVEQHRTMASPDAYASRNGYISGRSACAITYHKDFGETGRVIITPEMLKK